MEKIQISEQIFQIRCNHDNISETIGFLFHWTQDFFEAWSQFVETYVVKCCFKLRNMVSSWINHSDPPGMNLEACAVQLLHADVLY